MTPNPFTEIYKRLSNEELIYIIDDKNDYPALAVAAAILELRTRKFIDGQTLEATQNSSGKKNKSQQANKGTPTDLGLTTTAGEKLSSGLDPLAKRTPERNLKLLSLVLGLFASIQLGSNFGVLVALIKDLDWDGSVAIFLFELLFLPTALIPFARRKKLGRLMLSVWLLYNLLSGLGLFFVLLNFSTTNFTLPFLLTPLDTTVNLLTAMLSAGVLYYINKRSTRFLFR